MAIQVKEIFIKRWWAWLILFVIVTLLFSIVKGNSEQHASASQPELEPIEPEIITSDLGAPIEIRDVIYKVTSIERVTSVGEEYSTLNALGEFLVLEVEIQNKSKRAITTDPSIFKLQKQDIQFESDSAASVHLNDGTGFYMQILNPGLSLKGKIAYDIPKDTKQLSLYITLGQWLPIGVVNLQENKTK